MVFPVGTPGRRLETTVLERWEIVQISSVGDSQLHQHFIDLARLVAVLQCVKQPCVVSFNFLRVAVHVLHVSLGVLKGVSQHCVLGFEVGNLTLKVFIADAKLLDFFARCSDAVGDEALDNFLDTVTVL